jgi:hypothetical protein
VQLTDVPATNPAAADAVRRPSTIRTALRAAACLLLASSLPALVHADPAPSPGWQLDATGLAYSERQRTSVVEPIGRITRFFQDGQTFSAQLAIDAITGASPTGAMPTGQVQTVTSASGVTSTHAAGQVPTHKFSDLRRATDLEWGRPVGSLFNATTGVHFSREKDYQSLGFNEALSLDLFHRLVTVTVGGGVDRDQVFPVGGTPGPLADSTQTPVGGRNLKRATTGLVGISRVLSRRWLAGINFTRTLENGYLTEPYKVISLMDPVTGNLLGHLTESRPSSRDRRAVLASSVYHLTENILYLEYRYYWDDWGVRSHTADASYRVELPGGQHMLPHVRLYAQTAADFYQPGLDPNAPLPAFASADYRLGPLNGVTFGGTYGFHLPGSPGEWSIRAEYIRQWGRGPGGSGGEGGGGEGDRAQAAAAAAPTLVQAIPGLDIGSVVIGYSLRF